MTTVTLNLNDEEAGTLTAALAGQKRVARRQAHEAAERGNEHVHRFWTAELDRLEAIHAQISDRTAPAMSEAITLSRRSNLSNSYWIDGSRDRYGEAYFVNTDSDGTCVLWQNRRPYAVNARVGTLAAKPTTWEQIDALVGGAR